MAKSEEAPVFLDEAPRGYRPVSASERINAVLPHGTQVESPTLIEQLRTVVASKTERQLHPGVQVTVMPNKRPDVTFFERRPGAVSRLGQLMAAVVTAFEVV